MVPKDAHVLILRNLTWPKGLCRCDSVKAPAVGRLSWTVWVGPMASQGSLRGKGGGQRERQGGVGAEEDIRML